MFECGYELPVFKELDGSKPIGIKANGINGQISDELKSDCEDYIIKHHISLDKFIEHIDKKVVKGRNDD